MSSMISKKMGIAVNDRKVTDCIAKVTFVQFPLTVSHTSRFDDGVTIDTFAYLYMHNTLTLLFLPFEVVLNFDLFLTFDPLLVRRTMGSPLTLLYVYPSPTH